MQNHRSCVQAVLTTLGCLAVLVSSQPAAAADKPKYATDIPQSITTPDSVETRLGTLNSPTDSLTTRPSRRSTTTSISSAEFRRS